MLDLNDYQYVLPKSSIAQYPTEKRDEAKLLIYRDGKIEHHQFSSILEQLTDRHHIFFNNTKVIPARMLFTKSTGAQIEVLLLQPATLNGPIHHSFSGQGPSIWKCMIGNKKRWPSNGVLEKEIIIEGNVVLIRAQWADRESNEIVFSWDDTTYDFDQIIANCGKTPLPPYIERDSDQKDLGRYQTVYSQHKGAVAAPTAGLHFTTEIIDQLKQNHLVSYATLHVGAGTFQPIKEQDVMKHPMHQEQWCFTKSTVKELAKNNLPILAVGTTSLRALESLYWYGHAIYFDQLEGHTIPKLYPYQQKELPSRSQIFNFLNNYLVDNKLDTLWGGTELMIFPGYKFQMCDGLTTNFHQPGSTLLLLIAAFVGEEWRKIYEEALHKDYRFLSYGDTSLLWRTKL